MTQNEQERQAIIEAAETADDNFTNSLSDKEMDNMSASDNFKEGFKQGAEFALSELHKPSEPTFCPDCGYMVRLSGNGVAEQLCTCRKWPESNMEKKPRESANQAIKSVLYDYSAETIQFADEISERIQKALFFSDPWPPKPVGITVAAVSCVPLKKPSENLVDEINEYLANSLGGEDRGTFVMAQEIANLAAFNPNAELLEALKNAHTLLKEFMPTIRMDANNRLSKLAEVPMDGKYSQDDYNAKAAEFHNEIKRDAEIIREIGEVIQNYENQSK